MPRAVRIGVVAPSCLIDRALSERITSLTEERCAGRVVISFHPQCFETAGHFAGTDDLRARAFLEYANDDRFDVLWMARGGYGAGRIAEAVLDGLQPTAGKKVYLGYSDTAALLTALYAKGFERIFHAPMPADLLRTGGEAAVGRVLAFLLDGDRGALEPSVDGRSPTAAFNITILSHLIGTRFQPDLSGHVLMLEEVSEHLYRIDRALLQLTSVEGIRRVAGIRLGRCSQIPDNDPVFGLSPEEIARYWCERAGIAFLGNADIGHDVENKIVPFGRRTTALSTG